jgi:sterol desaturase/sphingolipid hydroxylase (fatty acid hydroxylase superfamily)
LGARLYVPALSIVAVAAVLVVIGWSSHWGGGSFAAAMTSLRVVVVGPVTLAFLGVFLVVERLRPAQRRPLFARGYRQDLMYTILNATLVGPLVVAMSLSFAEVARKGLPWIVVPHVQFVPRWAIIALIFVAMDGCNWLAHLGNHRIRVLWRFHELHHSQEDMSVLTVFRTHPLIHVSYLIALIPGIVLIANGAVPTALVVAYAAVVAFEHSNTNLGFGPLGRIFVSPNYHRIHHRLDGRQDVNLGFALTIWDQLSHRAVFPTEATIRADTGLPGRPLAVEQASDRPHHFRVFVAQLVGPFRPLGARAYPEAMEARETLE